MLIVKCYNHPETRAGWYVSISHNRCTWFCCTSYYFQYDDINNYLCIHVMYLPIYSSGLLHWYWSNHAIDNPEGYVQYWPVTNHNKPQQSANHVHSFGGCDIQCSHCEKYRTTTTYMKIYLCRNTGWLWIKCCLGEWESVVFHKSWNHYFLHDVFYDKSTWTILWMSQAYTQTLFCRVWLIIATAEECNVFILEHSLDLHWIYCSSESIYCSSESKPNSYVHIHDNYHEISAFVGWHVYFNPKLCQWNYLHY